MSNNYDDDEYNESTGLDNKSKFRPTFKAPKGVEFLKFTEEKLYKLDIIPFIDAKGIKTISYKYKVHKGVGPNKVKAICPTAMAGKPCPVCEAQQTVLDGVRFADADTNGKKLFKSFYPQERVLYNVMFEGKHYLLDQSVYKFSDPLARASKSYQESEKLEKFQYASPTNGYTITVQTAKTDNPFKPGDTFIAVESVGIRERKEQYDATIINDMVQLDAIAVIEDYATIEAMLYGGDMPEQDVMEEDEPEVEAPVESKPVAKEPEVEKPVAKAETKPVEKATNKCPHAGRFGVDFDQIEECEDCAIFRDCRKENKRLGEDSL